MLDWCKNHPSTDSHSEILLHSSPNIKPTQTNPSIGRPKFANTSQKTIRKLRPNPRRGSAVSLFSQEKADKQIQTQLEIPSMPLLVDSGTQTQKVKVQLAKTYRSGKYNQTSLFPTPRTQIQNSVYLKIDLTRPEYPRILQRSRKQSADLKTDNNVKTKATYCMADTKDKRQYANEHNFSALFGVESYHIPVSTTSIRPVEDEAPTELIKPRQMKLQPSIVSQVSSSDLYGSQEPRRPYFQKSGDLHNQHKYQQMLRNYQDQYKRSQQMLFQMKSLKNIKSTPIRRRVDPRMLYQKETILSKYTNSLARSDKEILIQQSVILERQAKSLYTALTAPEHFHFYNLYLAKENGIGMIVCVKQVAIENMGQISQELLIYRQLEEQGHCGQIEGILQLYQPQIDNQSYLLIKEPFTSTLKKYIQKMPDLSQVIIQIQHILEKMYHFGFCLKHWLKIEDFVVVETAIKMQELGIFTLEKSSEIISIDQAILAFRAQLLEHLA